MKTDTELDTIAQAIRDSCHNFIRMSTITALETKIRDLELK